MTHQKNQPTLSIRLSDGFLKQALNIAVSLLRLPVWLIRYLIAKLKWHVGRNSCYQHSGVNNLGECCYGHAKQDLPPPVPQGSEAPKVSTARRTNCSASISTYTCLSQFHRGENKFRKIIYKCIVN